jgi:hypothetical protein
MEATARVTSRILHVVSAIQKISKIFHPMATRVLSLEPFGGGDAGTPYLVIGPL